jgi:hypothetical protein
MATPTRLLRYRTFGLDSAHPSTSVAAEAFHWSTFVTGRGPWQCDLRGSATLDRSVESCFEQLDVSAWRHRP